MRLKKKLQRNWSNKSIKEQKPKPIPESSQSLFNIYCSAAAAGEEG